MKKNILFALILSAFAAQAQAGEWFAGASVGSAHYSPAAYTDKNGTAWGLNGGYAYNSNLAAEASYVDLGKGAVGVNGVKSKAASIAAVGTYHLNDKFCLFGRLGYASVDTSGAAGGNRHNAPTYGAGVSYGLTDAVSLRGGVDRYSMAFGDHATSVNAGLRYSFH